MTERMLGTGAVQSCSITLAHPHKPTNHYRASLIPTVQEPTGSALTSPLIIVGICVSYFKKVFYLSLFVYFVSIVESMGFREKGMLGERDSLSDKKVL